MKNAKISLKVFAFFMLKFVYGNLHGRDFRAEGESFAG
jgi:hypothetical protein